MDCTHCRSSARCTFGDKALDVCRLVRDYHDKMYMTRSEDFKRSELTFMAKKVDEILSR